MLYYIYQITNLVNNKIYVGVHKTKTLDDGYMGSGKVIKAAIQKYGPENFKKDILEFFENAELMYAKEKELVTEEFVAREDVYNLNRGGFGGFNLQLLQTKYGNNWREVVGSKGGYATLNLKKGIHSDSFDTAQNAAKGCLAAAKESSKIKRLETYEKIKHQQGIKNSQYGTCWIWHELIGNRKCKKELLPEFIEQGWCKGRKLFK